jgi:hypothetical protein
MTTVSSKPHLRVLPGGATNSRPSPRNETAVGADTVRLRWREGSANYGAMGRMTHFEGPRGERWTLDPGVRVGVYPDGLTYAEGRVAAMVEAFGGREDDHRLADGSEVREAITLAGPALAEYGLDVAYEPRFGRLDLAADLHVGDGQLGHSLLVAAASVDLPWLQADRSRKRGRVGSVEWRGVRGRSVQARLYDKSVESGLGDAGTWLRLERQIRWRKTREQWARVVLAGDLAELFSRRYLASLLDVPEVVVADRPGAIAHLLELVRQGQVDGRAGERLAGFLALEGAGLRRSTRYKRWAELRALGIAVDDGAESASVVNLADHVRAADRRWRSAA